MANIQKIKLKEEGVFDNNDSDVLLMGKCLRTAGSLIRKVSRDSDYRLRQDYHAALAIVPVAVEFFKAKRSIK